MKRHESATKRLKNGRMLPPGWRPALGPVVIDEGRMMMDRREPSSHRPEKARPAYSTIRDVQIEIKQRLSRLFPFIPTSEDKNLSLIAFRDKG